MNRMDNEPLEMAREVYEQVLAQPIEIAELGRELLICFDDLDGPCEISTCYGDIRKIIDTLMDYARLLEMACDQWDLQGFQRARYEIRADDLRKLSKKYQTGIRYDYEAALEKCKKKRAKKQTDDDVGGDAMDIAYRKALREAAKKAASAEPKAQETDDDPWEEEPT